MPIKMNGDTRYGFRFEDIIVERLFSFRGHAAVRIRSFRTGKYVDVQLSATGRTFHVSPLRREERLKGQP